MDYAFGVLCVQPNPLKPNSFGQYQPKLMVKSQHEEEKNLVWFTFGLKYIVDKGPHLVIF